MTNAQKKEIAKPLFLYANLTQKEIAERVSVTEKTIGKWCKPWARLKAATEGTKESTIARLYGQVDSVLIGAEKEGRTITDAEADKISKLNKTIGSMDKDLDLSIYIQAFQEYNKYLMPLDKELAKKNNEYQNKFINIKAGVEN